MKLKQGTKREIARWYKLKEHKEQLRLVNSDARFKVVPAGRRSGKTERFKRFIVKQAMKNPGMNYFAGAPTYNQAKRIFWKDLKLLSLSSIHKVRPSETELTIYLPNESTITVIGFDKPERFEGQLWHGGGIDEFGNLKDDAWQSNIKPALDTYNPLMPDYLAWCWLFGVPEGLNHYYDIAQYAINSNDPDYDFFTWKSSDILPAHIIEAAMRSMSLRHFRQEYEASFETATGRIYEDYNKLNHTNKEIKEHEIIYWCHDQNFTPLSSAIGVVRKNKKTGLDDLYLLDEIVLNSAISKQSAIEFCERYKNHLNKKVYLFGDPAGRAGEKHGHESDYTEIERELRTNGWELERRIPTSAPAIKDRQNSVRAMICNAKGERRLFVNPNKARYCDKGLSTVQTKKGSSFQEDQTNEYQHITTAIGYMVNYEWPIDDMLIDSNLISFNN